MKLPRRNFFQLAAGAAALPAVSRFAWAQAYPSRPVKIIVSFAAGGPTDILARLTAQWLSERLGQQFVVENRPGGGGNIGAEAVVRSAPDGYTLLMIDATPAVNATLYDKLNFDVLRDIAAIAAVAQQPQMMLVHPSVPAKTVPEFIAYAKANAGKINMASGGTGSPPHMAGELFKLTPASTCCMYPTGARALRMPICLAAGCKLPSLGRSPRWSTSRAERCAHWRLRQASVGAICQTFQP